MSKHDKQTEDLKLNDEEVVKEEPKKQSKKDPVVLSQETKRKDW